MKTYFSIKLLLQQYNSLSLEDRRLVEESTIGVMLIAIKENNSNVFSHSLPFQNTMQVDEETFILYPSKEQLITVFVHRYYKFIMSLLIGLTYGMTLLQVILICFLIVMFVLDTLFFKPFLRHIY